jgi:hypothetical protein
MDDLRFCHQARGSLNETIIHPLVARDMGYCPKEIYTDFRKQVEEIRSLFNVHIFWLKTQEIGAKEPGAILNVKGIPSESIAASE